MFKDMKKEMLNDAMEKYKVALEERKKTFASCKEEVERLNNEEIERARNFEPDVKIVEYKVGEFLSINGIEFPRKYIASIEIYEPGVPYESKVVGHEPLHYNYTENKYLWDVGTYTPVCQHASIKVTMISGNITIIYCSYHELDILYGRIIDIWKNYEVNNG